MISLQSILNKSTLPLILVLVIVYLFTINSVNAVSCESTSKRKINVILAFNNSDKSVCQSVMLPKPNVNIYAKDNEFDRKSLCSGKTISSSWRQTQEEKSEDEPTAKDKIREEILRALDLSRLPEVNSTHTFGSRDYIKIKNLIRPYLSRSRNDIPKYKYIVLFPRHVRVTSSSSGHPSTLMTFSSFSNIINFISADLWFLNGNFNSSFNWFKMDVRRGRHRMIASNLWVEGGDWHRVSIKNEIPEWKIGIAHEFDIVCAECDKDIGPVSIGDFNSFIVIKENISIVGWDHEFPVRSFDISEECTWPITIDFTSQAFRWNKWVVWPKSFNTNYCKGTCNSCTNVDCKRHVSVTGTTNTDCPYPVRTSCLEMIYLEAPYVAVYTNLPDVIIDECGCNK